MRIAGYFEDRVSLLFAEMRCCFGKRTQRWRRVWLAFDCERFQCIIVHFEVGCLAEVNVSM